MWKLLTRVFGSRNQRLVKELSRTVAAVNNLEASISALPDDQFPIKTRELKARFASGTPLNELVPEAFAFVREASRRKLGLRHIQRLEEFFQQHLAWMGGRAVGWNAHHFCASPV